MWAKIINKVEKIVNIHIKTYLSAIIASCFFLFAAPITCKSPKASDMRHISSRPTMKFEISSPNVFPVLRQSPVFFSLSCANKESTSVYHRYCWGRFMLVRSDVFACAFCVVGLMMLAAAPWTRIYLDSCREAEFRLKFSFRSIIDSITCFRDIPQFPL